MSRLLLPVILLVTIMPLVACKTWYKPGADGDTLAEDQQHCVNETLTSTGQVFTNCMKTLGWHYGDTSETVSGSESTVHSTADVGAARPVAQDDKSPEENPPTEVPAPVNTRAAGPGEFGGWVQFGEETDQLANAKLKCDKADTSDESFSECMQSKGWRPINFRITTQQPGELD
jgi:hypothetical protein